MASQAKNADRSAVESRLERELERLQKILRLGTDLRVKWIPHGNSELSGEVKNDTIYIYEEGEEVAKETLRHEVIDHAISQAIEPYKEVTNRLILLINEEAYRRKERLVKSILKLLE